MKAFIKRFDREQVGLDRCHAAVFLLATGVIAAASVTGPFEQSPQIASGFIEIFGVCILFLDFGYVAMSMVFTRGNWRQYCVYFVLWWGVYGYVIFLIMKLSLAQAAE